MIESDGDANIEKMIPLNMIDLIKIKAHSPQIAKPGDFSGQNSSLVDDSEDQLYLTGEKKQRFAIMR